MHTASFWRSFATSVFGTLLLAWLAAELCLALHTPLPWMVGPLLATAVASLLGAPTASWVPLRNVGQWVIGTVLGLYFTPQVLHWVLSLWWLIALAVLWAFVLSWGLERFLFWRHGTARVAGLDVMGTSGAVSRVTTFFASPIGAASEMTLMAERYGARTDLVAAAHTLRVLLVTLIVPFGVQWAGLHGLDKAVRSLQPVVWPGLLWLTLATGLGCGLMWALKRTNPWFIGALAVAMGLTAADVQLSGVPGPLVAAAQLVIGVSLGVRFNREFVHHAPRWLASVALATGVMLLASAGLAWGLSHLAPLHPGTLLLATTPGGIAEMAITAQVLQLGAPVVTAFQVLRLAAVLTLTEPLYRWRFGGAGGKLSEAADQGG